MKYVVVMYTAKGGMERGMGVGCVAPLTGAEGGLQFFNVVQW